MKASAIKIAILCILVVSAFSIFLSCSKNSSGGSEGSTQAPTSIAGKSMIWKEDGYAGDIFTFNNDGTVKVSSLTDGALGTTYSNSSYTYNKIDNSNAIVKIGYTSSFRVGSTTSTSKISIDFLLTFYNDATGILTFSESSTSGFSKEGSGPFLLGEPTDRITNDYGYPSKPSNVSNCAFLQNLLESANRNLESTKNLKSTTTSSVIAYMAAQQIIQINNTISNIKANMKKSGC